MGDYFFRYIVDSILLKINQKYQSEIIIYKPVLRFRNKAGVIVSVRNASFYQHGEPYKIGKKMTIRYTILNEEEDKYYIVNENFWFTWGVPVVITLLGASMLFFLRNGDTPE